MKTSLPIAAIAPADVDGYGHALRRRLDRWFYFGMAWLVLAVVAYGFGRGLVGRLLHPALPLPWILHVHALVFSGWVLLFLV